MKGKIVNLERESGSLVMKLIENLVKNFNTILLFIINFLLSIIIQKYLIRTPYYIYILFSINTRY